MYLLLQDLLLLLELQDQLLELQQDLLLVLELQDLLVLEPLYLLQELLELPWLPPDLLSNCYLQISRQ
jgi:hypothetical protein